MNKVIVARGDFISSIPLEYTHLFAAKICGVLAVMAVMDYLLTKYPNLVQGINLKIELDY